MDQDEEKRRPGRPATGRAGLLSIRLPGDIRARVDASLVDGERISDFVRAAIDRELQLRGHQ